MSFNIVRYWPFDVTAKGRPRFFEYEGGLTSSWVADPVDNAIKMINAVNGVWQNSWYMRATPLGVFEIRDDYPGKTLAFSPGIYWGGVQKVGDVVRNKPAYDTLACNPPCVGSGEQTVVFEKRSPLTVPAGTYDDVIQLACVQKWGHGTSWLRLWLARGIGPIGLQFREDQTPVWATRVS